MEGTLAQSPNVVQWLVPTRSLPIYAAFVRLGVNGHLILMWRIGTDKDPYRQGRIQSLATKARTQSLYQESFDQVFTLTG